MGSRSMALDSRGMRFDRVASFCLTAGRSHVLAASAVMVIAIASADWRVGLDISLGILYIIPIVLAALVLRPRSIIALALVCATLRLLFEGPHSNIETLIRFAFGMVAYGGAGLFVAAVMRTRREQALRAEAEEQLNTLIESSPAGILTLDERGTVLAANTAVGELFGLPEGESMKGRKIAGRLPVLADALALDTGGEPFRTAAQSQGVREDGAIFLADVWFSTYNTPKGRRLSAIVIDSSEEMRHREEQNLRQLSLHSRIMATAMLHEVRNLCSAISALYANLGADAPPAQAAELQALDHLVKGLARIASLDLHADATPLEVVTLREALNDLRIVVAPDWEECGGALRWDLPAGAWRVLADRHGLLQVFLNLAQNSRRAVEGCDVRELTVGVSSSTDKVWVRFADSGPGVTAPERLFQPFQPGAAGSGLGLYISRTLLRSYGGELRFEPGARGAAFVAELVRAPQRSS